VLKSALPGVGQAHWGERWDGLHLPGNCLSTPNRLEKDAFLVKDALFIVDDFTPSGSRRATDPLHEKAERLRSETISGKRS
jgi:hypothetical protein